MPEPRSLKEHVHDLLVWLNLSGAPKDLSLEQVESEVAARLRAYAEQEVTSQRIQLAALIHLLERVRDAEDPEEYLDDVAAVDESNLADEVRVFFQERDALLAVVRASIVSKAVGVSQCRICGHTWLSNGPPHYEGCPVAHPAVRRLLKEHDDA